MPRTRTMIRLKPDFPTTIAKTGIAMRQFVADAGVAEGTVYALLNPSQHPERKGGMQRATAWKLANAYARRANISPEAAYAALIVEEPATDGATTDRARGEVAV
jgi:hypothetical protein